MTTSVPLGELGTWLADEVARGDAARTVVLAGHYAIFSAGAHAVDFLDGESVPPPPASEMVAFTRFTWDAACDALASPGARAARLLVLVDDMTFVRPMIGDTSVRERLGDALASQYHDTLAALPRFHTQALAAQSLNGVNVFKPTKTRWVFSERDLRIAHVRRLKEVLRAGGADGRLTANPDASYISITLDGQGEHCLVHSGHTNCAGGYLELLATLHESGVRRIIALVPMRCVGPIAVGTSLAHRLLGLDALCVVNVAVPDVSSGLPASVLRDSAREGVRLETRDQRRETGTDHGILSSDP